MKRLTKILLGLAAAPVAAGDEPAGSPDITFTQLEWQHSATPEALAWNVDAWFGSGDDRLLLRDEGGRHVNGALHDNRLEILWASPRTWFGVDFELLLGARHDSGTTPSRTYAAMGFLLDGPAGLRLEGTGYLGDGSRYRDEVHAGIRLQAERDWRLGSRLSLTGRAEYEMWSEDHVRYSEGIGPTIWSAGLRLHYSPGQRVAPYVGVEWFELLDDTAVLSADAGEIKRETRFVAGLRMHF